MITGLVLADGGEEALAVTLAALVPAVVAGLVGDAVVIAPGPDPAVAKIAEVTGATTTLMTAGGDPWRAGAAVARREWLLCLAAGDVPTDGWVHAVDRFLARALSRGQPLGRFSRRPRRAGPALVNAVERFAGTSTVRAGDLVRREWLAGTAGRVRPVRIGAVIERDPA